MNLTQAVPRSCATVHSPSTTCTLAEQTRGRGGLQKKNVNTLLSDGKCDCGSFQRPFVTWRVQSNLAFSLNQVIPSLDLFQNRFDGTPARLKTKV